MHQYLVFGMLSIFLLSLLSMLVVVLLMIFDLVDKDRGAGGVFFLTVFAFFMGFCTAVIW